MWDKSIMCLRDNSKCLHHYHRYHLTNAHPQVIKSVVYLWKLIWKFAACSGLVNLAMAFLCWGIMENICGRERSLGVSPQAGGAVGPRCTIRHALFTPRISIRFSNTVAVLDSVPHLYGTDGPEQVPQLCVCGGGGQPFYGDGATFVPWSPLALSGRWRTASTHLPSSSTSTPARHDDLQTKAGVRVRANRHIYRFKSYLSSIFRDRNFIISRQRTLFSSWDIFSDRERGCACVCVGGGGAFWCLL